MVLVLAILSSVVCIDSAKGERGSFYVFIVHPAHIWLLYYSIHSDPASLLGGKETLEKVISHSCKASRA